MKDNRSAKAMSTVGTARFALIPLAEYFFKLSYRCNGKASLSEKPASSSGQETPKGDMASAFPKGGMRRLRGTERCPAEGQVGGMPHHDVRRTGHPHSGLEVP